MSGDLRERLAAALYRLEWQADLYTTPRNHVTERYERRADRLLPLIRAERDQAATQARAEVVERVEAELQNAEDGKGSVDEADDWWVEVAVVRAALNEARDVQP